MASEAQKTEQPKWKVNDKKFKDYRPDSPPDRDEDELGYKTLLKYCDEVQIIIHVVDGKEYKAALQHMGPPCDPYKRPVKNFPEAPMVIGKFAKKKAALVQTAPGDECRENIENAVKFFPNALYILLVGACYATDKTYQLGDVLVSNKINNKPVKTSLKNIFCSGDMSHDEDFIVSDDDRESQVHDGNFVSSPTLKENLHKERAIGGDMEGKVVLEIVGEEKSVIIIKGVAYYADAEMDDWKFTAAMAAFSYTKSKLSSANLPSDMPLLDEAKYEKKLSNPPDNADENYRALVQYCDEVEIIIHVVNEFEFKAALQHMDPPCDPYKNPVMSFPVPSMAIGKFANKKVALVQTDQGDNCRQNIKEAATNYFKNAQCILLVGVAYAFDERKHKLGDVLVSNSICDMKVMKFKANGELQDRGQTVGVQNFLKDIFCKVEEQSFVVSTGGRKSKVHSGQFISCSTLMDNQSQRDTLHKARDYAIGGEMEGRTVLDIFQNEKHNIKGIIIIKGVVDYGDGKKKKDWQFTTAMAAFNYTKTQLERVHNLQAVISKDPITSPADGNTPTSNSGPATLQVVNGRTPASNTSCSTNLTMKDHHRITLLLGNLAPHQIMTVGGALGLYYPTMQRMSNLPSDMVASWLNKNDNVTETPSVTSLAKALREVGYNGVASQVEGYQPIP